MASSTQAAPKRKKTPAERQARFEAIGERYRLAHASDDGSIRVDGLLVAAKERAELVEKTARMGTPKRAGIDRTKWTDLGPDKIGGRGRALIIDPANANRMWFGAATGGIWTTTDGGANWSPVNDYLPNLAISDMQMDATNANILYAASGEPFASGVSGNNNAFRGVGIFKSVDRGVTWNLLEATRPATESSPWIFVNRLAINPANGSQLWAATRSGGLWQSADGGATWQKKTLPSEDTACGGFVCPMTDVLFHPANPQQLVVAAGARMYSSSDGGLTFTLTALTDATAARTPGATVRVSLAAARSVPGRFYASVNHADTDTATPPNTGLGQIWATSNGGTTWSLLSTPRHLGGQGDYDNAIWVDPTDANLIVVAGIDVWRSLDGGASFQKISDWRGPREFQAHADHHLIVHHPGFGTSNRTVFVANDGGVQRATDIRTVNESFDASSGWTRLNTKLRVTQFYTIVSRLVNGQLQVLGGTQDNGNPLLRPTGTTDWEDITGGDGAGVGIDSRDPRRMYTAYIYSTPQSGVDGTTRQSRICTTEQMPGGCADNTGTVVGGAASNFIAPMILDPNNSDRLLTGTNDVLLSTNPTAETPIWRIIKAGFARTERNWVANIEVAKGNSDVIMVGHNGGQIFRTTRGTQADVATSWTQVSTADMPQRYNTSISIDPRNPSRAWVTFGGFERSNVWFTANGGQTWTNIHSNLPQQPVYRVLPHPTTDNWLYAATESGVYTSEDGGATWTAADDGPANVIVHDMMFVSDSILVVGTHGRGAWRVDTLTATPGVLTASPASLDFGGQSMNTTAPALAITLTNGGTTAVTVSSVSVSSYFAVTHNCATLAAGSSCKANVTFTPGAQGSLNGTLTITFPSGFQTVALTGTGEKSLVTHYYRSILRRAPDAGGKSYWDAEAARVQALGVNVNEVWFAMAGSFYSSPEYVALNRDNAGYVTDLYGTFFNRAPDAGGFADWTTQLGAGMPREVVLAAFMFSQEFANFTQAIFGTTITRKEVDTVVDFYRGLLGSLPDDSGFNFWLGLFRTAQCQGGAAVNAQVEAISSAFANSAQYANRGRTNAQYMGDLYNAFLRRGGDLGGVQFWIGQIATNAQTRDAVRMQFVASGEFNARVNAIIAQGCLQ